jgi:hypothetical protein
MSTESLYWLNAALQRMSRLYDFREMFKTYSSATVASTETYSMPTNWKVVMSVRIIDGTNSIKLQKETVRRVDEVRPYPAADSTGRPNTYMVRGNYFDLNPIPDAVYTMYMRTIQWPTVITDSATLIDYEPNKDDVVLAFTLCEAFKFFQMETDSLAWEAIAMKKLREIVRVETNNPDWEPKGVGFNSASDGIVLGEYYNNPLVLRSP